MAVMKQGILGGLKGKVANVVGSSWKGIAVLKALPLSVANPRTAGQVAQRSKLANVVAFAKILLAATIKPLWDRFASGKSGYNVFVSTNIDLFANALPSVFSSLVISVGKMAATAITAANANAGTKIADVSWSDDSGEGFKLASDILFLVAINQTTGEVTNKTVAGTRADTGGDIEFSNNLTAGDVVHIYMSFLRADGTIVSNNSYISVVAA